MLLTKPYIHSSRISFKTSFKRRMCGIYCSIICAIIFWKIHEYVIYKYFRNNVENLCSFLFVWLHASMLLSFQWYLHPFTILHNNGIMKNIDLWHKKWSIFTLKILNSFASHVQQRLLMNTYTPNVRKLSFLSF